MPPDLPLLKESLKGHGLAGAGHCWGVIPGLPLKAQLGSDMRVVPVCEGCPGHQGWGAHPQSPESSVLLGETCIVRVFAVFWCFDIWGLADPGETAPPGANPSQARAPRRAPAGPFTLMALAHISSPPPEHPDLPWCFHVWLLLAWPAPSSCIPEHSAGGLTQRNAGGP